MGKQHISWFEDCLLNYHDATSLLKSSTKEQLIQYIKTICSNCSYSFGKEIPDDSSIHYNLKNSFNCISRLKTEHPKEQRSEVWWTLIKDLINQATYDHLNNHHTNIA